MAVIEIDADRQKTIDLFKLGNVVVFGNPKALSPEVRQVANGECVVTGIVLNKARTYVDLVDRHVFDQRYRGMPASKDGEKFVFAGGKEIGTMVVKTMALIESTQPRVIGNVLTPDNVSTGRLRDFHLVGREITSSKRVKGQITTSDIALVRQPGREAVFVPHMLCALEDGDLKAFDPKRHSLKRKSVLESMLAA